MKTFSAKAEEMDRSWFVIDADGQVVGHVAERAARLLRGKDKAIFTSHVDCGDHVVIINAEKARFTGKKEDDKVYTSYSGYVGGQKTENPKRLRERRPELILERAVRGMIPHNKLGTAIFKKLHIYTGTEHPHEAQNPAAISL
ncbi:MAG: 50S ribosomal protein L13 [Verrucomicrobiota bacterium]